MADTDPSESPWADDVPAPPTSSLPDDPWADRRRAPAVPSTPAHPTSSVPARPHDPLTLERARSSAAGARSSASNDAANRRWLLIAVATVASVAIGSLLVLGGGRSDRGAAGAGASTTADEVASSGDRRPSTVPALTPVFPPVTDADTSTLPDDETVVPTTVPIDALVPPVEPVSIGSPPAWTEWTYPIPPALQRVSEPTELIALTAAGVLHRIEFPSGTVRSVDTGAAGRNASMYVSGDSVLLQKFDSLVLLRPGAAVTEVDIGVGIGSVLPRGDTGEFLAAPNEWSDAGPPPLWIVGADGRTTSLAKTRSPLVDYAVFPQQFLPTGELLVFDAGGTYVVPDDGAPSRLSSGLLFATGRRHVIARECDETLRCSYVVIDTGTGERRATLLDVNNRFAFYSQGSVSPDGRTVLFTDWTGSRPATLLLDLQTGASTDHELLRSGPLEYESADLWAADSSGVFVQAGGSIGFLARDGASSIELDGLGAIVSLAIRR